MLMLCDNCVRSLRKKGEKIKVRRYEYGEYDNCDICGVKPPADRQSRSHCGSSWLCDTPDFLSGVICKNDELNFHEGV
jgi:hypothetical protein